MSAEDQIDKLAKLILENASGEIGDEGAGDVAVRLLDRFSRGILQALLELGQPHSGYPAPVASAIRTLNGALGKWGEERGDSRPTEERKPILVLDFDGVLHDYQGPWKGAGVIEGNPIPGAREFCKGALDHFDVWIVSYRCSELGGANAVIEWLERHRFTMGIYVSLEGKKPPAFLTIDDRAVTFDGTWPDIETLASFVPWNREKENQ